MSNKLFIIIIVVLVFVTGAVVFNKAKTPPKPRLGIAQQDKGRKHIKPGEKVTYKNAIPTSGPHGEEASWGYSPVQLPNENIIHNMEHGGIVVSYRPDLNKSVIQEIIALYTGPYTADSFHPTKVVIMPRAEQQKPIVLASWNRLLELDNYDQQTLIDYYLSNVGHSPEPGAS
jgi:hypothetical protein